MHRRHFPDFAPVHGNQATTIYFLTLINISVLLNEKVKQQRFIQNVVKILQPSIVNLHVRKQDIQKLGVLLEQEWCVISRDSELSDRLTS